MSLQIAITSRARKNVCGLASILAVSIWCILSLTDLFTGGFHDG
jgi:hypothetical protein